MEVLSSRNRELTRPLAGKPWAKLGSNRGNPLILRGFLDPWSRRSRGNYHLIKAGRFSSNEWNLCCQRRSWFVAKVASSSYVGDQHQSPKSQAWTAIQGFLNQKFRETGDGFLDNSRQSCLIIHVGTFIGGEKEQRSAAGSEQIERGTHGPKVKPSRPIKGSEAWRGFPGKLYEIVHDHRAEARSEQSRAENHRDETAEEFGIDGERR